MFISTNQATGAKINTFASGTVTEDSNSNITAYQETSGSTYAFTNALGDIYSDAYVRLGSSAAVKTTGVLTENLINVQAIVGELTTSSGLLSLASLATPATYNILGSTAPIAITGSAAPFSATSGNANAVTGNMTVNFSSLIYSYSLNNISVNSNAFSIAGNGLPLTSGNNQFSSVGVVTETSGNPANINTCVPSCTGSLTSGNTIQGGFYGANVERLGLQYGFITNGAGEISGSVVLGR